MGCQDRKVLACLVPERRAKVPRQSGRRGLPGSWLELLRCSTGTSRMKVKGGQVATSHTCLNKKIVALSCWAMKCCRMELGSSCWEERGCVGLSSLGFVTIAPPLVFRAASLLIRCHGGGGRYMGDC